MQILITTFLAVLILTPLLYSLSRELRHLDSLKSEIERFEEIPDTRNFVRRWLFGWQLGIQRSMHRTIVQAFGDKLASFIFRLFGYFFLFLLVMLWVVFGFFVITNFAM